ncbi:outer membrane protein assembly factor BamE [Sphingoaurantiacus capsulatus]|uniref:Outer membrane protein assembly factor BamE n=1 Tax=Sphingoaurantiacus capsulatus TaxID=1771310 RepID=A0ABV7XBC7_9SPHN
MRKLVMVSMLIGLGVLPACTRTTNTMGYIVDEVLVAEVKPGIDNRASVEKALGKPSIAGQWDDKTWYYVSRNTKQTAFLMPKPTEQSIIAVSFDAKGNVASVNRRGLEQVANVDPVNDKTPTLGRETGVLEDLFGNIGRFGSAGSAGGPPQ